MPRCSTASDCPSPPDHALTCSPDGLCVGSGGGGGRDGGPGPGPDGGPGPGPGPDGGSPGMGIDDTISDEAQLMTLAFDGLAFVTGNLCTQTFYPPGKVADFFGFQFWRDNDASGLGHNSAFTTYTADPILVLLKAPQLDILKALALGEDALNNDYAYARFPLASAFRRVYAENGATDLNREAVKAYAGDLFAIDGQMSWMRAQAYSQVLAMMDATQLAALNAMKATSVDLWTQPTATQIGAVMSAYPQQMMRTYAGEMMSWFIGNVASDVYFCPERQATYFGSFFMKDIVAMHEVITIDSNLTATAGMAFLNTLDATQRAAVAGLVARQKNDLLSLVAKREEISVMLRSFLANGSVDQASVIDLSREYGALDGEISYFYVTVFSHLGLTPAQQASLLTLRKGITAPGTTDYDTVECPAGSANFFMYSRNGDPVQDTTAQALLAPGYVDFMFQGNSCVADGGVCVLDWDCCSYVCGAAGTCEAPAFALMSEEIIDGGILPDVYACSTTTGIPGTGVSPPLYWVGTPVGTTQYALTLTTESVGGTKDNWVLHSIPGNVASLAQATSGVGVAGASTDGPLLQYYPPCPGGPGQKVYTFTLYALSSAPTLPSGAVTGDALRAAISGMTVARSDLVVKYTPTIVQ